MLDQWLSVVRRLPVRMQIAGIAIVLTATLAGGAVIALHPTRAPLFAQSLRPEQLNEVQTLLAQWDVPFTPLQDNVIVDAGRRSDVLLRLSLAGVPHEHLAGTAETLSAIGALTPQTVIDAQAREGLAGDIAIALRSVSGVDDARVIVAPAKPAEFSDERGRDASASVRLVLHPGAALQSGAVAGIRAFVAASVAGLDPSRVTILDDRGVALDDRTGGERSESLQTDLQSALDAAFGEGETIVRVFVTYSHISIEAHDVRRTVTALPVVRDVATERYADGAKRYVKSDDRVERGSDNRETTTQQSPGTIARISTAVLIDAGRALDAGAVRAVAAATVGYDPRRGDTLDVQVVPFKRVAEPRRDMWFLAYGAIVPTLPTAVVVLGIWLLSRRMAPSMRSALRYVLERSRSSAGSRAVAGYAPTRVRDALEHEPPHTAAAIISALPAATAAAVLELYPAHEREAIVARMQRAHSRLLPDIDEFLERV